MSQREDEAEAAAAAREQERQRAKGTSFGKEVLKEVRNESVSAAKFAFGFGLVGALAGAGYGLFKGNLILAAVLGVVGGALGVGIAVFAIVDS